MIYIILVFSSFFRLFFNIRKRLWLILFSFSLIFINFFFCYFYFFIWWFFLWKQAKFILWLRVQINLSIFALFFINKIWFFITLWIVFRSWLAFIFRLSSFFGIPTFFLSLLYFCFLPIFKIKLFVMSNCISRISLFIRWFYIPISFLSMIILFNKISISSISWIDWHWILLSSVLHFNCPRSLIFIILRMSL